MDINSRDINSVNYHGVTYSIDANGYYSIKGTLTSGGRWVNTFDLTKSDTWGNSTIITEDFMLKKGTYTLSVCDISGETSTPFRFIRLYKKPFTTVAELHNRTSVTFTLNEDTKLSMMFQTVNYNSGDSIDVKFKVQIYNSGDSIDVKFKVQIEDSTQVTSYEPYKTSILSCNEDITLCGIGEVKDELDLLTSELTQRVGKTVLDGTNTPNIMFLEPNRAEGYTVFPMKISDVFPNMTANYNNNTQLISNNFNYLIGGYSNRLAGKWMCINAMYFVLSISNDELESLDIQGLNKWLSLNKTTIYYPSKKSIKTVDLNVVDQDRNVIPKVKSYKDVTHLEVTVPKQSLLPNVSAEVATDNSKDMSLLTTKHQEISETQSAIQDNIQSQSDEIDTALMATTEIFESILE